MRGEEGAEVVGNPPVRHGAEGQREESLQTSVTWRRSSSERNSAIIVVSDAGQRRRFSSRSDGFLTHPVALVVEPICVDGINVAAQQLRKPHSPPTLRKTR